MSRQQGFTLIEMAIVLAIMGLLVGGGLIALGPVLDRTKINQTNANLDQIENALALFAIRNNRLPCPADGHLTNSSPSYGIETSPQTNSGTASAACPQSLANSVIPWKTLGLDEQYSVDGWSNRISYFPASGQFTSVHTLVDNPATTPTNCLSRNVTSSSNSPRNTSCDPTTGIQGTCGSYPYGSYLPVYGVGGTTELTSANPSGSASCTASANLVGLYGLRAAYVLISHGKSGWYAWNKGGVQMTPPGAAKYYTNKYANSVGTAGPSAGVGFFQGTPIGGWPPGSNASYFDDIVRWRSPGMIIQLCGSGACGNP